VVPFGDDEFSGTVHLEVECPTGLKGTPPTLDALVDGPRVLAVESKAVETFSPHEAKFRPVYESALSSVHRSWREEYERLIAHPRRYRYLDAAQLIKHYLGLRTTFNDRPITLAYLYWRPTNADEIAASVIHAAETREFASRVGDPAVRFVPMSYANLWDEWSRREDPPWLVQHAKALHARYDVTL
jgi:hypothetical protein